MNGNDFLRGNQQQMKKDLLTQEQIHDQIRRTGREAPAKILSMLDTGIRIGDTASIPRFSLEVFSSQKTTPPSAPRPRTRYQISRAQSLPREHPRQQPSLVDPAKLLKRSKMDKAPDLLRQPFTIKTFMKMRLVFLQCTLLGLLVMTSCNSAGEGVVPAPTPTVTPQATAVDTSLPAPIPCGQTIMYHDLRVTMDRAEITDSYISEYGSSTDPSAGNQFLWVRVVINNMSQQDQNLPAAENFSALLEAFEFKPGYGHRQDHPDYTTLNAVINQGDEVQAWLRFDIPAATDLKDLMFAFLPESTQVSVGFSSDKYAWADHPVYLWTCKP